LVYFSLAKNTRFQRTDQVVAYAGLDIEVKQSGKWKGQAKLSKRGSGRLRRILYLAVARGLKKRDAMMAVMRKMLIVAYRLLRTGETYDPTKVGAGPQSGGVAPALRAS
jgi:transposase